MTLEAAVKIPPQPYKGRLEYKAEITVVGLFGKQGSGKSAIMAFLLADAYDKGRKVFYWPESYQFVFGTPLETAALVHMTDAETYNYINGAIVGIDEMQVLLNRFRMGATVNQTVMAFFQQLRKRGVDMIYTSNAPQRLDRGLEDQTTFHGMCEFSPDDNCRKIGYHYAGCMCTAIWRMKDTQGAYGFKGDGKDRRKVVPWVCPGITEAFRWYNTHGTADAAEVLGMDKRSILQRAAEDKAGLSMDELCRMLRTEWVPKAVEAGATTISPGGFAAKVNADLGLALSDTALGKAFRRVGLVPDRRASGVVYTLPPKEALPDWQQGLWAPGT